MVIFNSYVSLPEGTWGDWVWSQSIVGNPMETSQARRFVVSASTMGPKEPDRLKSVGKWVEYVGI